MATGSIFYDADCPFCLRWVRRLGGIARRGGFNFLPLQSETARRTLSLAEGELPPEMKLRLADGRILGGVDALIELTLAVWWTAPLAWLLRVPGLNALARRAYRRAAAQRYCLGDTCRPTWADRKGDLRHARRHTAFLKLP